MKTKSNPSTQPRNRSKSRVAPRKPLHTAIAAWVENLEERRLFSHGDDDHFQTVTPPSTSTTLTTTPTPTNTSQTTTTATPTLDTTVPPTVPPLVPPTVPPTVPPVPVSPPPPTNVIGQATNVSASDSTFLDKVQVTWTAAPNADHYHVFRNASNSSAGRSRSWPR